MVTDEQNVHGTEQTPPTAEGQEKTFTQAELDEHIRRRLERERKKYPTDEDLAAFRQWQDGQKTEQERLTALTGERDALSGRLTQAEAERVFNERAPAGIGSRPTGQRRGSSGENIIK